MNGCHDIQQNDTQQKKSNEHVNYENHKNNCISFWLLLFYIVAPELKDIVGMPFKEKMGATSLRRMTMEENQL